MFFSVLRVNWTRFSSCEVADLRTTSLYSSSRQWLSNNGDHHDWWAPIGTNHPIFWKHRLVHPSLSAAHWFGLHTTYQSLCSFSDLKAFLLCLVSCPGLGGLRVLYQEQLRLKTSCSCFTPIVTPSSMQLLIPSLIYAFILWSKVFCLFICFLFWGSCSK